VTGKSVDPDNLDDLAGGLTALGNNKWAIHRIYSFTSNNVKMQRGQNEYDSKAEALAAIQTETFVTEPSIAANGLLRAFLILQKGATDLSDSSTAVFIDAGKFGTTSGAGGGEVTSLQKAYDNSSTPEITTSTLLGAFSLKRGSAADTDDVFEVQNGAGTQVMAVTGQGSITAIADLEINEAADHTTTPAAGKGIIWVKSDAPSSLMYTNDAGDDLNLSEEVVFMPFLMPSGTGTQTRQCSTAFPYSGTITKIEMCHNKTTSANATNYWTIMPRNRGAGGTGTTSLLSAAWSGASEAITSGVVEDLGALANTSVTAGEMVDIVWTANGTPANYFGDRASLMITMLRTS
jgi:hypothetical protein